jgi:hypothetical protein
LPQGERRHPEGHAQEEEQQNPAEGHERLPQTAWLSLLKADGAVKRYARRSPFNQQMATPAENRSKNPTTGDKMRNPM